MVDKIDEKKNELLHEELDKSFPRTPFAISCISDIYELDEVFSDEQIVVIVDDRAKSWFIWDHDFRDVRNINNYINYTVVKKESDQPITMRHPCTLR